MGESILSPREIRRYNRQIMLDEIGVSGQEKLKRSKVLVIGAGGLGCPVLQYLAAAGIGKIAIAENDLVDETNLQRQVLYGAGDVGKLKSIIAAGRLESLNDLVETSRINLRIGGSNALDIIKDFDIIVEATDNYQTRYVVNDACVLLDKPMVHGAIFRYEGQVSVFNYRGGATYRCFNRTGGESGYLNPEPARTGLFGVLPGITGTIMANEVIKIITGIGEVLSGKLLMFNLLNYSFNMLTIKNMPENHQKEALTTITENHKNTSHETPADQ